MNILIQENDFEKFKILEEETKDSNEKSLYITGPFIQTEVVNNNKRIYPKENIKDEINNYIVNYINTNRSMGELNHPKVDSHKVNPERACIKIESLVESGSDYIGKAKVLKSLPMGSIVYGLIKDGVQLGVSSRASGSTITNAGGIDIVQKDFKLVTPADVITEPSAPDAFITSFMEQKEWVFQSEKLLENQAQVKSLINNKYKANISPEVLKELFETIINKYV